MNLEKAIARWSGWRQFFFLSSWSNSKDINNDFIDYLTSIFFSVAISIPHAFFFFSSHFKIKWNYIMIDPPTDFRQKTRWEFVLDKHHIPSSLERDFRMVVLSLYVNNGGIYCVNKGYGYHVCEYFFFIFFFHSSRKSES